jgi:peptidoglycan-N-acetylglucosamine deacetylase
MFFAKLFYGDKLIWNVETSTKTVYLTFDDGPEPDITTKVLDILKEKNAKATFFCTGKNAEKHIELFNKIKTSGHVIGNHGYEHLRGWGLSQKKFIDNALKNKELFPGNLFRPPYGAITPSQAKAISKYYKIIMWTILSKDYSSKMTPEKCLKRIIKRVKSGDIIVFHDSKKAAKNCLPVLPKLIDYLKNNGYEFGVL